MILYRIKIKNALKQNDFPECNFFFQICRNENSPRFLKEKKLIKMKKELK